MGNLHGKTFIVTGASSGIGQSLSTLMAKAGANLVLNARREELLAESAHLMHAEVGLVVG
jgi:short-subunit dehydrogenase